MILKRKLADLASFAVFMVHGTAGCLKALAGQTINLSPETVHDDEGYVEAIDGLTDQPVPLREYMLSSPKTYLD